MEVIIATVLGLLPIINPFIVAPLFLMLTPGDEDAHRNYQARRSVIYMFWILIVCAVAGTFIMKFFGLSLPGMRIAGGIMITSMGLSALHSPKTYKKPSKEAKEEAKEKEDISLTPLAMPTLAGPGAISVVIGMSSLAKVWYDYIFVAIGMLIVSLLVYIALRFSSHLVKFLGLNGLEAMTKIMGFITLCIGIQFFINGTVAVLTSEVFVEFLRKVIAT